MPLVLDMVTKITESGSPQMGSLAKSGRGVPQIGAPPPFIGN